MQEGRPDWRDSGAYAPLLDADRSLFAWEWLRRDPGYRAAADDRLAMTDRLVGDRAAAAFGLVRFEAPGLAVPGARPCWRFEAHPFVLRMRPLPASLDEDPFDVAAISTFATVISGAGQDHLLLCDGLQTIRLDAPAGTFSSGPICPSYCIDGIAQAEPSVLALRRFLSICRTGRFARSLHPPERRARRWILMLRALDALAEGVDQRTIAATLLSCAAREARWRSREASVRSQVQRLVRAARTIAETGGYMDLLR